MKEKLEQIAELMKERGRDDYESLRQRLLDARKLFHDLLSERIAGAFNAHLTSLPQYTLREKQSLTRDANSDLRSLGLAIRCPKTGQPAVMHADPGYDSSKGRFEICLISADLGRKRTLTSGTLIQVDLMGNPNRREGGAEYWTKRLSGSTPPRTKR